MHKHQLGHLKANSYDVKKTSWCILKPKRHNCILILPIAVCKTCFISINRIN